VASHAERSKTTHTPSHTIAYCKKTPAQHRRDDKRKILHAKRRRVEVSPDMEKERTSEIITLCDVTDISMVKCDTPLLISCAPPEEKILVLTPLSPIKVDFGAENSCKIEHDDCVSVLEFESENQSFDDLTIKCPNCYEANFEWNHVCDADISEVETTVSLDERTPSLDQLRCIDTSETLTSTCHEDLVATGTSASKVSDVPTRVKEDFAKRFAKLIALEILRPPDKP